MQQVCGALDAGFSEVGQYLKDINCNISELRGEINAMASMLDWKLSLLIEEQRLTNQLLGHIAQLLRIPDSQKQRVYHIEQGLKYFKNASLEGIDSTFYVDALEGFKEAERIEHKDYITLNYIGQIHLYSKQYMDFPLAEKYFLKSAREAFAEANVGGTNTSMSFRPGSHETPIYDESPFRTATAEAYLYAGRSCYLQKKLPVAIEYAAKAYNLIPAFVEAGFEQAKYLAANGQEDLAANILADVINKDRYYSTKTLLDADLLSKKPVLTLLKMFQEKAVSEAKQKYDQCFHLMTFGSKAHDIVEEVKSHLTKNSFLSAMKALDLLIAGYQLQYSTYSINSYDNEDINEHIQAPSQTLVEFIKKENESSERLEELKKKAQRAIITSRVLGFGGAAAAMGFVVGFFRGCTVRTFSMDGATWFGTLLFFALFGALIGLGVGMSTEPKIKR